jgi:hypothetical protein
MEDWLLDDEKKLPNGKLLHVVPLTYGRARLHIGPADTECYDDGW